MRRNVPASGSWKVRVTARTFPSRRSRTRWSSRAAWAATTGSCSSTRRRTVSDDVIEVRVIDNNAASPITVNVASTTETGGENLSIPGANGVYVGTIPTTPATTARRERDGLRQPRRRHHGDVHRREPGRHDRGDGRRRLRWPGHHERAGRRRRRRVGDDRVDDRRALHVPGLLRDHSGARISTPFDSALATTHSVTLSGLASETTYYFDVESKSHSGDPTRDDLGGSHYRFTSGKKGDILLVIGDPTFDKVDRYTQALDNRLGLQPHERRHDHQSARRRLERRTALVQGRVVAGRLEQYPPFENEPRDSLTAYHDGGARLGVISQDVAWTFTDPASGISRRRGRRGSTTPAMRPGRRIRSRGRRSWASRRIRSPAPTRAASRTRRSATARRATRST